MLAAAHPASVRGRLEAYGYAFTRSFRRDRLTVTRRGAVVGDLDSLDAEILLGRLIAGQHDTHCAEPRRRAAADALAALRTGVDAAIVGAGR